MTQSVSLAHRLFYFETSAGGQCIVQSTKEVLQSRLSGVDFSFIYKQDRNVVADGIHAPALAALQAFMIRANCHRLLTDRADEYVEQVLGNHRQDCTVTN
jgi:hypothetical protein